MIRNKKIILPFLLLAWTIIFAHSIIPHHHHDPDEILNHCKYHHSTNFNIVQEELHDCDHDCGGHTCHFHVDVLTKLNIDKDFIISSENIIAYNISVVESEGYIYNQDFITQLFSETNFLRGPPQIA